VNTGLAPIPNHQEHLSIRILNPTDQHTLLLLQEYVNGDTRHFADQLQLLVLPVLAAHHLPVYSAVPPQSVPTLPSVNPDANYRFDNAFAKTQYSRHKVVVTFLFERGIMGIKQNVNIVSFFCGRTETL